MEHPFKPGVRFVASCHVYEVTHLTPKRAYVIRVSSIPLKTNLGGVRVCGNFDLYVETEYWSENRMAHFMEVPSNESREALDARITRANERSQEHRDKAAMLHQQATEQENTARTKTHNTLTAKETTT